MTPLIQVLSIGTMATWLTVSGATSVACLVKVADHLPGLKSEVMFVVDDGEVVDLEQVASSGSAAPSVADEKSEEIEPVEPLPEPPPVEEVAELPDVPEIEPLPEVPDLPEPKPDDFQTERPKDQPRVTAAKPRTENRPQQASRPRQRTAAASSNTGTGTGTGGGVAGGSGSGSSGGAARFAGGRMPAPSYPSSCRAANQEGRVVVLFTVDEQGNVVSVTVKSPATYPAMNEAAVNAVRRWKFKPGPRASMQRPIVFKIS